SPGEIVALTGKSGSGKTSIGLAILGLLPNGIHLSRGNIEWNDGQQVLSYPRDVDAWRKLRGSHIGFIQQDAYGAFDPVIKMRQQLLMIIRERSVVLLTNVEELLTSTLKEVGIEEVDRVLNSYPHQLSGGQLQRCQLCLSIIIQPQLIIADEPTSAIDKMNQLEILNLFARVRNDFNIAVLCITHEPSVESYLADRVINLQSNESIKPINLIATPEPLPSKNKILEVSNIAFTHRYGGIFEKKGGGVRNINFSLSRGECLGILGESGSGKSTIAQILVSLIHPDEGEVILDGKEVQFRQKKDIQLLRSKIQLVMQDGRGSLHPDKKIRDLLEEVTRERKKNGVEPDIKLENCLSEVGLPVDVLNRRPGELSGGECLRICIARALLLEPEILIGDESTSALDKPTRDDILELLKNLMKTRHLGVILISHDPELISQIADKILVISKGEIVETGTTTAIFNEPKHVVTKEILSVQATLSEKKKL
ncbi:MAG: ATP-binding cassette domain-containing protein, partial [Saprospiraceae bacterium]